MKRHLRKWVEAHTAHLESEIDRLTQRNNELQMRLGECQSRSLPLFVSLYDVLRSKRQVTMWHSNDEFGIEKISMESQRMSGGRRRIDRKLDHFAARSILGVQTKGLELERMLAELLIDALSEPAEEKPC